MKKIYLVPRTEAIKLLAENAIMAVSPGVGPHSQWGGESDNIIGG